MFKHPLVNFVYYLGLSISMLMTNNYYEGLPYFFIFFISIFFNRRSIQVVINQLKPIFFYFPMMLIFYLLFSFYLTDNSINQILSEAFFGFIKIIFMIGSMSLFFETTHTENFINIFRSMWFRTKLTWKWPENFFLFLSITLRFYPTIESNWNSLLNTRQSLGLKSGFTHFEKIKIAAKMLPGLMLYQLYLADDIANAMKLRGYGKKFPRGIAHLIDFRLIHLGQITLILFGYWGIDLIVSI